MMKLRITITVSKVHDVGYRYLLLGGAMGLRLLGFDASNLTVGRNQVVDIVVDGKESQIEAFKEYIETNRPSGAKVSHINVSDYEGDVMRMTEYAQILTALQMLKAIPTILEIRDSTRKTEEISGRIEETGRNMEENTQAIPTMLDEVRGMRSDLTIDADWKRRMESDIKAIKAKIGI
jgi:acylphosphatase